MARQEKENVFLYSQSYEPSEGKVYCVIFYRDGYFVNSISVFV